MSYQKQLRLDYQVDAIVHNKNKAKLRQNRLITSLRINECTNLIIKKYIKRDLELILYLKDDVNIDYKKIINE